MLPCLVGCNLDVFFDKSLISYCFTGVFSFHLYRSVTELIDTNMHLAFYPPTPWFKPATSNDLLSDVLNSVHCNVHLVIVYLILAVVSSY